MKRPTAGFGVRLMAAIIDTILSYLLQLPFTAIPKMMAERFKTDSESGIAPEGLMVVLGVGLASFVATLIVSFVYIGWFYSNKGGTPGKLMLKLKVVDHSTGEYLGYWRAFGRETFGKMVSMIILGGGYLMVLFRQDRRALHDLIFDTVVVVDDPRKVQ